MLRNFLFIIFYFLFANILDGMILSEIFIFQCILIILEFIKKGKPISLYLIFALGQIPVFFGNTLTIYNSVHHIRTLYTFIVVENIDLATQILCIGNSVIFIAMEVAGIRKLPRIDVNVSDKIANNIFYISFTLSLLNMFNIFHLPSGLTRVSFILSTIGILFLARLWSELESEKYRKYAITLTVLQTILALGTYLRTELITPVLFLFAGYFLGKKSIKFLFTYRIVPFMLFFLIFLSVFSKLGESRSDFASALSSETDVLQLDRYTIIVEEEHTGFFDRESDISQVTAIVNLVKKNGFYNGTASAPLVISLIPRFLWPEKPIIQLGTWFALQIGAAYKNDEGHANNSVNMTLPGEFYLDFGWAGVIIICFFIGYFVMLLWNSTYFTLYPYNATGILFGGYLIYFTFIGFGADAEIIVTYISVYLLFFLLKKLI